MSNPINNVVEKLIINNPGSAALVCTGYNRRFLTKFPSSAGAVFITGQTAYLLVDFRYAEAARKKAQDCEVILFESMNATLTELIKKHNIKSVYLEIESLPVSSAQRYERLFDDLNVETVIDESLDEVLMQIRMIKSDEDVRKIQEAQKITDAAFDHVIKYIKEGVTEKEIALEIEFFMKRNGAEALAFDSIVAAGKNGSMCHAVPSGYKIQKGDFITMDTGAMLDGYHSDMTRTVALGEVSEKQKHVYNLVLKAHMEVINKVKPGEKCCDIDKIARDIIDKEYPGAFGHGLGHGVGFEIHEEPRFSKLDNRICKPGMVITDEPGIYIENEFGVRIEDMLLITETGCRSLTNSPKELIIL